MVHDLKSFCGFETKFEIDICYFNINTFLEKNFQKILNYQSIKEQDISEFLNETDFFSEEEIIKISSFKSFKRQIEWVSGRIAVRMLAGRKLDLVNYKSIRIDREAGGAPFLPDFNDCRISISHSNGLAAAGLSTGKDFGIDAEYYKSNINKHDIMNIAFTEPEKQKVFENEDLFYYIWTVKEAYLKYIKMGFAESLKSIEVTDSGILKNGILIDKVTAKTWNYNDYIISVVF